MRGVDCRGGGRHQRVQEAREFGDFNGFRIGHQDDIRVAHLHFGGKEITAGIAEIDAEDHRDDVAWKPRHIDAK